MGINLAMASTQTGCAYTPYSFWNGQSISCTDDTDQITLNRL